AVNVEGHSFDGADLWAAAEDAMSGRSTTVRARNTDAIFKLRVSHRDNRYLIELTQEGGNAHFTLSDPAFALLQRDRAARRTAILSHQEWFDCDRRTFEKEARRIADNPNPRARFRNLKRWKQRSAAFNYASLVYKRNEQKDVTLSDFHPPPVHGLLSHLRLPEYPGSESFAKLLERSAHILLDEVGFADAFRRLASLPCRMPPSMHAAFKRQPAEWREKWINEAIHEFLSPVSRTHLIAFLAQTKPERAIELLEQIPTNDADKSCEAFQLIHFWTIARIEELPEVAPWQTNLRLSISWLHASRLFNILARSSPVEPVAEFFARAIKPTTHDVFRSARNMDTDAAHPLQVRFRSLYVHALAALLAPSSFSEEEQARVTAVLHKLCFVTKNDKTLPHPDLMLPADWRRNSTGSYLQGDLAEMLHPWLGEDASLLST